MPFESDRQRRFMFAKHPGIAHRWVAEAKEAGVSPTKHKRRKKLRRKRNVEKSWDLLAIDKAFNPGRLRPILSQHGIAPMGTAPGGGKLWQYQHRPGFLGRIRGETSAEGSPFLHPGPNYGALKTQERAMRAAQRRSRRLAPAPPAPTGPSASDWLRG